MRTLILTLLLMTSSAFAKQQNFNFCTVALSENAEGNVTETFAAYLQHLKNETVVSTETLQKLKDELEQNKGLSNPVVNKSSSDYEIHFNNVNDYLTSPTLDRIALLKYLTQFLAEQEQIQNEKNKTRIENKDTHVPMQFYHIEKGSYKAIDHSQRRQDPSTGTLTHEPQIITIEHSFLMMHTKVTEKMWSDIYGNDIKIENRDLPKANVTVWSAMQFANKMSERDGLKPSYLFDLTEFKPTTFDALGTLEPNAGVEPKIRFNSLSGKIYDTEGYRLPTDQEQWFARTNRGEVYQNALFPGLNYENICQYAWLKNTTDKLMPVAERPPLMIDGKPFFDLYGNTYEHSHVANSKTFSPTYMGGSFRSDTYDASRVNINNGFGSIDDIGFRLVRTIHPEKKP